MISRGVLRSPALQKRFSQLVLRSQPSLGRRDLHGCLWHLGRMQKGGWVYIMTNKPHGVLYIGVTSDLAARVCQHREGTGSTFVRKFNCTRLIFAEPHDRIEEAITREKAMKAWPRLWKLRLIHERNPEWHDLYDDLNN